MNDTWPVSSSGVSGFYYHRTDIQVFAMQSIEREGKISRCQLIISFF